MLWMTNSSDAMALLNAPLSSRQLILALTIWVLATLSPEWNLSHGLR